jgi:thioredoxin 1
MNSVIEIADSQFNTEISNADRAVLVYFWADWCGPCRLVSPSIAWVAGNYGDRLKVLKLEVDKSPESVARCRVEGVPALRIFKGSEMIAEKEGAIGKAQLQSFIDSYL